MKKQQKILYETPIIPTSEKGLEVVGTAFIYNKFYFKHLNTINFITATSTINSGEVTTEEIIDSQIKKYDKVWQELA